MSTVMKSGMYISLKKEDYAVIQNDIEMFSTCVGDDKEKRLTFNRFMNTIFLYMTNRSGSAEENFSKKNYSGAVGMNIKLNNNIAGIMKKAGEKLDPNNKMTHSADCAVYYRHFIEKYCRLPLVEREKIFYAPMIESLDDNISLNYFLKITKTDGSIMNILPFAIKQSDEIHKNYLIGFALKKMSKGYRYKNTLCIPLRKIKDCRRIKSIDTKKDIYFGEKSEFGSYEDLKSYVRKRLITDGVLYLSGKLRDVTVRLSDTGLKKLGELSLFRPAFTSDKNDEHIIRFSATQLQTFKYFFQFGSDAEILEPSEYRKDFFNAYKSAFELYS